MYYLQINLQIATAQRSDAAAVFHKYKQPFLAQVPGARSKALLLRDADVQVLHGFASAADAQNYLASPMFTRDVVGELGPLLSAAPEIRVYHEEQ